MDKYRVCPTCGTKNPPMLIECSNCETDLTGIPVGNIISNNKIDDTKNSDKDTNKMVRICDCGAHNPVSSRKCLSCGEDISDKADEYREFVNGPVFSDVLYSSVKRIVMEEADAFFQSEDITAEETAKAVENKVMLYLDELS